MTDREAPRAGDENVRAPAAVWFSILASTIVALQLVLALLNIDAPFTRGHNGFNGAAYLNAARNSLRFETPLPYQFHTDVMPPPSQAAYTHAPLALHLHDVVAVWLLGDTPRAVRSVAALHGLLVVLALLYVGRAHWSPAHALIAAGVYTLLPINVIYVNMTNHSAGMLFWALLMFHSYLRLRQAGQRRWLLALLATCWCALQWDWPAYYLALFLGLHWLASCFAKTEPSPAWRRVVRGPLLLCLPVLCALFEQWLLMRVGAGSEELGSTFRSRQDVDSASFERMLHVVPRLMFTAPLLALTVVWLLDGLWRVVWGRAQTRDLVPVAFGAAALMHLIIFRQSAWQHEYWLWPALPCVALCTADLSVRAGRRALRISQQERPALTLALRAGLFSAIALPTLALFAHSAKLLPAARQVGGSMWFLEPVRSELPQAYDAGSRELRFADKIRSWTDRTTGVLLHASLDKFMPEARFDLTLDRPLQRISSLEALLPPVREGVRDWVVIGAVTDHSPAELLALADGHALTLYDHYFMLDLRRSDGTVRVFGLERLEPSPWHRFFRQLFEPPVREVRNAHLEAELLRTRTRAQSGPAPRGVDPEAG